MLKYMHAGQKATAACLRAQLQTRAVVMATLRTVPARRTC
jgi:hypothetical protein